MTRYGSIYVVTNTVTGEQYVGQTRQKAARRWKTHINTANSQATQKYKLTKAIIEHGKESFEFVEVFSAFDAATLNAAEIKFIEELSPVYNITKGGAGHRGVVASAETCKARSERLKRQWANTDWRATQIEKLKQLSNSPEATQRGKCVAAIGSAARAKHVFCPEIKCSFLSVSHAAKYLNVSHTGVRYALRNGSKIKDKFTILEVVN
jgi:group I intron endonuclease